MIFLLSMCLIANSIPLLWLQICVWHNWLNGFGERAEQVSVCIFLALAIYGLYCYFRKLVKEGK